MLHTSNYDLKLTRDRNPTLSPLTDEQEISIIYEQHFATTLSIYIIVSVMAFMPYKEKGSTPICMLSKKQVFGLAFRTKCIIELLCHLKKEMMQ